jgi:hypothetical protein
VTRIRVTRSITMPVNISTPKPISIIVFYHYS